MEAHVKALALLYILVGAFSGVTGLILLAVFAGPAMNASFGPLAGTILTGWIVLMLILAIPSIVLGVGLLHRRPWARTTGMVIAILELLNFPVGTVLGGYTLWVLLTPETDPLFTRRYNQ